MNIITENDISTDSSFDSFILESIAASIPKKLNDKLGKLSIRNKMLREYGTDAFLDPDNLKFPVMNPDNGNYECVLIYTAKVRAIQTKQKIIAAKASRLLALNNCTHKLKIHINDNDNISYDLIELIELLS